jgi:hypothetical protein
MTSQKKGLVELETQLFGLASWLISRAYIYLHIVTKSATRTLLLLIVIDTSISKKLRSLSLVAF